MGTVTVATFAKESNAEAAKKRLEEAHIPTEIQHESTLEWLWFVATPVVKVQLKVRTEDHERAIKLLQEWDAADGILREAIHCPECGSARVEYPQFTRKFFLPNLLGLLAALGLVERQFYCENCHYTWPRDGRKRSVIRPHQAPYYFIEGIVQPEKPEMKPNSERSTNPGAA